MFGVYCELGIVGFMVSVKMGGCIVDDLVAWNCSVSRRQTGVLWRPP